MLRPLSTAQIPAQPRRDVERSVPEPSAAATTEHDHAWRRMPKQRDTELGEYRCDLCELSYSE